jgi:membrane-bound ClpP family serine protease
MAVILTFLGSCLFLLGLVMPSLWVALVGIALFIVGIAMLNIPEEP